MITDITSLCDKENKHMRNCNTLGPCSDPAASLNIFYFVVTDTHILGIPLTITPIHSCTTHCFKTDIQHIGLFTAYAEFHVTNVVEV